MTTPPDASNLPASVLDLSLRGKVAVLKTRAATLGQLCRWSEDELYAMSGFGEMALLELKAALAERGLALRADPRKRLVRVRSEYRRPVDFWEIYCAFRNETARDLDAPIAVLDLCTETIRVLRSAGLPNVRSLCSLSAGEIRGIAGLGEEQAEEVASALRPHGLPLHGRTNA